MTTAKDNKGVRFATVDGEEICFISADHSEAAGFAMEAADENFPRGAWRIEQLRRLLSTGVLLNNHGEAQTAPTDEQVEAAGRTAEEIVDALTYGVPPKLAAFLGAGQTPELVAEINGWLSIVLGQPVVTPPEEFIPVPIMRKPPPPPWVHESPGLWRKPGVILMRMQTRRPILLAEVVSLARPPDRKRPEQWALFESSDVYEDSVERWLEPFSTFTSAEAAMTAYDERNGGGPDPKEDEVMF